MQNTEKFIVDYLKESHPALDVRPGTGIRDLLITPFLGIIDRIRTDIDELRSNSDLTNYRQLDPAIMDLRASNWFVKRQTGSKATGTMRIFLTKKIALTILEGHRFFYGNLVFKATNNNIFRSDDLTVSSDLWYCDVTVEAIEEGVKYNIQAGELTRYEPISPYVDSVKCVYALGGGSDIEGNGEFYARIKQAITIRNLVSPVSIETTLKQETRVRDVYVAGFGSREMRRDIIVNANGSLHIGGMVDIYVKKTTLVRVKTFTVDVDKKIIFGPDDVPVYRITQYKVLPTNPPGTGLPALLFSNGTFLNRFSRSEGSYIQTDLDEGTEVDIAWETMDIKPVDLYCTSGDNRVVGSNVLVRGMAPVYVNINFDYKLLPKETIDLDTLRSLVVLYINNLPRGTEIEISDLDILIRANFPEIDSIIMPVTIHGELHTFDNTIVNIESQNSLTITEDVSKCLSKNTIVYIAGSIQPNAV